MTTTLTPPVKPAGERDEITEIVHEPTIGYRTVSVVENGHSILPAVPTLAERAKATFRPDLQRHYKWQCVSGGRRLGRSIVLTRSITQDDIELLDKYDGNEAIALNFVGSIIKAAGESQEETTPSGFILLSDALATLEPSTAAHMVLPCTRPSVAEAIKDGDVLDTTWSLAGVDLRSGVIGALSIMGTSARTEIIKHMAEIDREATIQFLDLVFGKWNDRFGAYGGAGIMRSVLTKAGYAEELVTGKIASTLENYMALKKEIGPVKKPN